MLAFLLSFQSSECWDPQKETSADPPLQPCKVHRAHEPYSPGALMLILQPLKLKSPQTTGSRDIRSHSLPNWPDPKPAQGISTKPQIILARPSLKTRAAITPSPPAIAEVLENSYMEGGENLSRERHWLVSLLAICLPHVHLSSSREGERKKEKRKEKTVKVNFPAQRTKQ